MTAPAPKWTPGPWFVNEDDELVYVKQGWGEPAICAVAPGGPFTEIASDEERCANLVLCSAAPDLYAAVEAQHRAIDWLFAQIMTLDRKFMPSKSLAWAAAEEGYWAMQKALGAQS